MLSRASALRSDPSALFLLAAKLRSWCTFGRQGVQRHGVISCNIPHLHRKLRYS